jgi:N-methylhydantoinase B
MQAFDPIELAVFKSATRSVAEEMGASLRRTAFSPNIKERRDYSCAVFDSKGQAIAMGDHMPVHLGSMPMSVRAAVDALTLGRGDIAILNDGPVPRNLRRRCGDTADEVGSRRRNRQLRP